MLGFSLTFHAGGSLRLCGLTLSTWLDSNWASQPLGAASMPWVALGRDVSLSAWSPQDPAGNWRLWSTPPGHQSQLLESRLVTAQGVPKGAWVGGSKRPLG